MKTLFIFLLILPVLVSSGPVAYGLCQTACNYGAVTCYTLAGLTFGVPAAITGPVGLCVLLASTSMSTIAAAAACSAAQGTCMAACTPLLLAPTP
ncbi:unnamed protein product [Rotaria socialis]|uniref:Uncharacterized protein n=1 Tax=Rotaria socialis TaxID=392032 RepID=A0A818DJA0_9BILA|nr:unnamed protein product [Rotaria socialis]CAF4823473.1 unnamed protein product [Rotaria socialis]